MGEAQKNSPIKSCKMSCFRNLIIIGFLTLFLLLSFHANLSNAQDARQIGDPVIIRVIQLEHANAEDLARALAPLFPKQVQIIAYSRTNTLIIKGKKSLVNKLVEIIKGNSNPPNH